MWKFACEGKRVNDHNHTSIILYLMYEVRGRGRVRGRDGGESVVLSRLTGWFGVISTASQSNSPHSSMHSSAIGR